MQTGQGDPGPAGVANREQPVVCIPPGQTPHIEETLGSIASHTAAELRIVLCGSPGADGMPAISGGASPNSLNVTASEGLSQALVASAPADVVIVTPGCVVAAGWLEGLHDAAYSETTAALSSALPVSELGSDLLRITEFDQAAAAVRSGSPQIRPRINLPYSACNYIRRSTLELVGYCEADATADPRERGRFAARCLESGLCHVLADDVLVLDPRRAGQTSKPLRRAAHASSPSAPLRRAIEAARRTVDGLSVVVDARIDAERSPGTQLHVIELIAAIARTGAARVTAVVDSGSEPSATTVLENLPGVRVRTAEEVATNRADVVHRPFQVSTPADLAAVGGWADRLIITQQDLISYRNPSYFRSSEAWEGYRRVTRRALAAADWVVFFSAHARADAVAEDLVEPHRTSVVHIGVDHQVTRGAYEPVVPRDAALIPPDAEVLLCLGTDFRHKNRVFALRTAKELQRQHGWSGWLVLAGPHLAVGSSAAQEQEVLAADPSLASAVLDIGAVSEAEKAWLMDRATLVICPSVYEGFGLVPFEAADHGVPCLWAKGTSQGEILPDAAAGIVAWDAHATADAAALLMRDSGVRSANLLAVREAAGRLHWQATAERLLEVYRCACNVAPAATAAHERSRGLMQEGLSEDAVRLVGPGGALPPDLERPLLALATHPKLAGPLFGAIKAGYRASRRWKRARRRG